MKELKFLNVYGQSSFHDDLLICGTKSSLEELRSAIDRALINNESTVEQFFVSDGEGYTIRIVTIENDKINHLAVPYWSEDAEEKRKIASWPYVNI